MSKKETTEILAILLKLYEESAMEYGTKALNNFKPLEAEDKAALGRLLTTKEALKEACNTIQHICEDDVLP